MNKIVEYLNNLMDGLKRRLRLPPYSENAIFDRFSEITGKVVIEAGDTCFVGRLYTCGSHTLSGGKRDGGVSVEAIIDGEVIRFSLGRVPPTKSYPGIGRVCAMEDVDNIATAIVDSQTGEDIYRKP